MRWDDAPRWLGGDGPGWPGSDGPGWPGSDGPRRPGGRAQRHPDRAQRHPDRPRPAAAWIAGVLCAASVGGALVAAVAEATGHQVDFDIYRMGGGHFFGSQLYQVRLPRALMGGKLGMHFTYPPFAALVFVPLSWLPVRAGQVIWSVFNVAALFTVTALSLRAARPQWPHRTISAIAALALFPVMLMNPNALTVDLGQVNAVLALLVLADFTCGRSVRSRRIPRGAGVGIAAAVKLTPLIFIPLLVLTRQFRAACTAVATFAVCSIGAWALTPRSSWLYWSAEIFDGQRSGNVRYISDQNLASALQRMAGGPPSPVVLALATALFGCGGLALAAWAYRTSSPLLGIIVCAATGLVISPVSWVHHYVWVVPVLAWLTFAPDRPRSGPWWALGLAALLWAAPVWWVPDPQTGYGGPLVLLAGNSFFLALVALLAATTVLLARRARSGRAAPDRAAGVPGTMRA